MKMPKMIFSQRKELKLNADTKVIIMKPGQDLYLRYAPKVDKMMRLMFGGKNNSEWIENEESYNFVNDVMKNILIYSLRNPNDYRKKLLVDNDQVPSADQEYYEDFNPVLDGKILESQGCFKTIEDDTKIFTPILTLFFIVLRESGWITTNEESTKENEEVDSFLEESEGNEEINNCESLQPETE